MGLDLPPAAIALAIVFARLSRAYPQAGGPYAYVNVAFGPLIAFIVAWGYWISICVGNVTIVTGVVSYLSPLQPWISRCARRFCRHVTIFFVAADARQLVRHQGGRLGAKRHYSVENTAAVRGHHLGLRVTVRASDVADAAQIPLSMSGVTAVAAATLTLWALARPRIRDDSGR